MKSYHVTRIKSNFTLMRISVFILLGFLLILSMFAATTYINFRLAGQVNENSEWLSQSTVVVRNSNRFQRNILNMISGLRGYIFTGEGYFLQSYDSALIENQQILEELEPLISREEIQQKSLRQIGNIHNEWVTTVASPLIEAKKSSFKSDSSMTAFNALYRRKLQSGEERKLTIRLNTLLRNFINYEYSVRESRKTELDKSLNETRTISILLTSSSVIFGLFITTFLAVRISRRIVNMVAMANTIAGGNYDVHTEVKGKDELSKLERSLNHMASVLSHNISMLKRKNQELDQFAHIVSHDMKAPLRGIDNVVNWIEEDHYSELSPKVKEYIGLIKSRITRGENLINGILSYSRVGRLEMRREEVNVNVLLEEIAENIDVPPGIHLNFQRNMPVLHTERLPLMQVFTNLLQNAAKHHDKESGHIKVTYSDHSGYYAFHVQDNGPGISENYHKKIFVIFQTLHSNDSFESTGVGLAIVKKILDDRNQTISISSAPGKGSTFSFTWPKENFYKNGKSGN